MQGEEMAARVLFHLSFELLQGAFAPQASRKRRLPTTTRCHSWGESARYLHRPRPV
jgi:hypothetical protein